MKNRLSLDHMIVRHYTIWGYHNTGSLAVDFVSGIVCRNQNHATYGVFRIAQSGK
jgi:hypothetical protein